MVTNNGVFLLILQMITTIPKTNKDKLQVAKDEYERIHKYLREKYGASTYTVKWDGRGKSQLGYVVATWIGKVLYIRFNVELLFNDKWFLEIVNNTIPHELAHAVGFDKGLCKGHDKQWKMLCIELGGTGSRCASIKDSTVQPTNDTMDKKTRHKLKKLISNLENSRDSKYWQCENAGAIVDFLEKKFKVHNISKELKQKATTDSFCVVIHMLKALSNARKKIDHKASVLLYMVNKYYGWDSVYQPDE